nr:hypothetical protein [Chloroflexota bacterium]
PLDDALQVVPRDAAGASADPHVLPFGCSDGRQALVWLLRDTRVAHDAMAPMPLDLLLPGMTSGEYKVEFWETYDGNRVGEARVVASDGTIRLPLPDFGRDIAVAVRANG